MSDDKISGDTVGAAVPSQAETMDTHSGHSEKDQMVPLAALQSERAQRQAKEQEAQMLRDNIALLQANLMQQQQTSQPKDDFESMSESDVLTVGEAKKFMAQYNRQHQLSIDELRMTQRYPDYQEVVTRYLPEVLKTNPNLQNTLKSTQDYELAYYLAKNSDAYKNDNKRQKINADAERIVQNSQSAGSLSSVGSTSLVSHTKRYKEMSDADFIKEMQRNLGH